ncbi:hypothetical protein ES704_02057 [subsurface metagenome]|jgi:hypothetical protein
MRPDTKAFIAREGGRLVSDAVRIIVARPHRTISVETAEVAEPIQLDKTPTPYPPEPTTAFPPLPSGRTTAEEVDYRWECCMKHLGGASILLREAYERAIDEGMGEGTAEKIMEAMNEHSGMETDLEKMLPMPEAREQAEKLMSGVRAFRKAAWEAKLVTGGGTKEDLADARMWNDLLYQEAFNSVKSQPGQACIEEGM